MRPTKSADEIDPAICTKVEWIDEPLADSSGSSTSRSTLLIAGYSVPIPAHASAMQPTMASARSSRVNTESATNPTRHTPNPTGTSGHTPAFPSIRPLTKHRPA